MAVAAVSLLLFSAKPAHAEIYDGAMLALLARDFDAVEAKRGSDGEYLGASRFSGYVTGVFDILTLQGVICAGETVSVRQIGLIASKWLRENPEKWQLPAGALVTTALRSALPCNSR